jgi:hypothetical protein
MQALTEKQLELAEENEASLLNMQLLQTVQMQRRVTPEDAAASTEEPAAHSYGKMPCPGKETAGQNASGPGPVILDRKHDNPVNGTERREVPALIVPENRHDVVARPLESLGAVAAVPADQHSELQQNASSAKNETSHDRRTSNESAVPMPPVEQPADILHAGASPPLASTQLKTLADSKGPSISFLHWAAMGVFFVALVTQILICIGMVNPSGKKPLWDRGRAAPDNAIRTFVQQMPISSSMDLESDMPSGSSTEQFLKPLSSGGPVRMEVKIEGLLDRSTVLAPFTRRPCVMYSATATSHGEQTPARVR